MGSAINPEFLRLFSQLKTAALYYNNTVKLYGPNSPEADKAFEKRKLAESVFASVQGVIEDEKSTKLADEVKFTIDGYMNQVKSWYV